ncbi:sodium:solute symporter family transporter [Halomonas huangheensis]|uniref:Sodium:solute symporter n=1 Tax=Halomonas huangheensis TaxID=1178482 RepID=W1N3C0_9GAMM|nr:hypothetical protein [Halomonas huangheensis]ALM51513.1 sodium:solute symporter [Halomonas huangheensis]ERL49979.1 hypothetical protein BJB45_02310 [Halomonas huangheensis]
MTYLTIAVLGAALLGFILLGLAARRPETRADDYLTARNSQSSTTLALSFVASGMGAWILFAPPEIGAFVGPLAVAGYAVGSALPFIVLGLFGPAIRRRLPQGRSIAEFAQDCHGAVVQRCVAFISILYMACFLAAELTAIGAITELLSEVPGVWVILAVALSTLCYTTIGGLRASLATDRWQALLLIMLLVIVVGVVWRSGLPTPAVTESWSSAPPEAALSVALTLVIAVTAANLFHQGYWQRLWAARDDRSLVRGAWLGGGITVVVVAVVGALGMWAAVAGLELGSPPIPFFALLSAAPAWLALLALVLAVTLVASSVDTLQNGLASLLVSSSGSNRMSLTAARWITVLVMLPVVLVALQGVSVLRLFLIADLLCAAIVVPVMLGLWARMVPAAAMAGGAAGLVATIVPGWLAHGSPQAGLLAASFPDGIPTLAPFVYALLISTLVSIGVALLSKGQPKEA